MPVKSIPSGNKMGEAPVSAAPIVAAVFPRSVRSKMPELKMVAPVGFHLNVIVEKAAAAAFERRLKNIPVNLITVPLDAVIDVAPAADTPSLLLTKVKSVSAVAGAVL